MYLHTFPNLIVYWGVNERNILDGYFTVDIRCDYILFVKTITWKHLNLNFKYA